MAKRVAKRKGRAAKPVLRRRARAAGPKSRHRGGALVWNPKVACRTLDETAFILLSSRMVRLNPTGTRIWELFEKGATIAGVVEAMVTEFETTRKRALADTRAFVRQLTARELLVPVAATTNGGRTL